MNNDRLTDCYLIFLHKRCCKKVPEHHNSLSIMFRSTLILLVVLGVVAVNSSPANFIMFFNFGEGSQVQVPGASVKVGDACPREGFPQGDGRQPFSNGVTSELRCRLNDSPEFKSKWLWVVTFQNPTGKNQQFNGQTSKLLADPAASATRFHAFQVMDGGQLIDVGEIGFNDGFGLRISAGSSVVLYFYPIA